MATGFEINATAQRCTLLEIRKALQVRETTPLSPSLERRNFIATPPAEYYWIAPILLLKRGETQFREIACRAMRFRAIEKCIKQQFVQERIKLHPCDGKLWKLPSAFCNGLCKSWRLRKGAPKWLIQNWICITFGSGLTDITVNLCVVVEECFN